MSYETSMPYETSSITIHGLWDIKNIINLSLMIQVSHEMPTNYQVSSQQAPPTSWCSRCTKRWPPSTSQQPPPTPWCSRCTMRWPPIRWAPPYSSKSCTYHQKLFLVNYLVTVSVKHVEGDTKTRSWLWNVKYALSDTLKYFQGIAYTALATVTTILALRSGIDNIKLVLGKPVVDSLSNAPQEDNQSSYAF